MATPALRPTTAAPQRVLRPLKLVLLLGGAGGLLLTVGLIVQILDLLFPDEDILGDVFFNPDREANAWSWYSTLLLAALSLSLVLHAALRPVRAALPFAGLALLALYMSLDEGAEVHEKFEPLLPEEGIWTVRWLAFGVPLAVAAGLVAYRLGRGIGRLLRRRLVAAGLIFLSGAVVMEAVEYAFLYAARLPVLPRNTVPYALGVFLEEGLEMLGVLVALWAVLSALTLTTGDQGLRVEYRQDA